LIVRFRRLYVLGMRRLCTSQVLECPNLSSTLSFGITPYLFMSASIPVSITLPSKYPSRAQTFIPTVQVELGQKLHPKFALFYTRRINLYYDQGKERAICHSVFGKETSARAFPLRELGEGEIGRQ
jgi:hypothetical protein